MLYQACFCPFVNHAQIRPSRFEANTFWHESLAQIEINHEICINTEMFLSITLSDNYHEQSQYYLF